MTNSNTCLPIDFKTLIKKGKNNSLKICHDEFTASWWHKLQMKLINEKSKIRKPCEIHKYAAADGDLRTFYEYMPNDYHIQVEYTFKSDELVTRKEFLVTDDIRLIGTVGGTMGLFIGFSFQDMIKKLMATFKKYLMSSRSD